MTLILAPLLRCAKQQMCLLVKRLGCHTRIDATAKVTLNQNLHIDLCQGASEQQNALTITPPTDTPPKAGFQCQWVTEKVVM